MSKPFYYSLIGSEVTIEFGTFSFRQHTMLHAYSFQIFAKILSHTSLKSSIG